VDHSDLKKYRFVRREGATFEAYFQRYQDRPYTGPIDLSEDRLDFVLRFEELQEGFSEVLRRLGLKQVRPVPLMNKTQGRRPEWQSYYTTSLHDQAIRNFGPFMRKWGYEFPPDWGEHSSRIAEAEYRLRNIATKLYRTHVRYNQSVPARMLRVLRASLSR